MLLGIDLAWNSQRNSGMAIGHLSRKALVVDEILSGDMDHNSVFQVCKRMSNEIDGIAVDAPLIVPRERLLRVCDRELTRKYIHKKIACYPPMTSATSRFSDKLVKNLGLCHAGRTRFIIEVYPHPAIVEIFGLKERIPYKKGRVDNRRTQLVRLKRLIMSLERSTLLCVLFSQGADSFILKDPFVLRGKGLKEYEDGLDAVVCLYVAGLWALNSTRYCRVIGDGNIADISGGYIVVPKTR